MHQEAEQFRLLHLLRRNERRVLQPGGQLHRMLLLEVDRREALICEDAQLAIADHKRRALLARQHRHHGRPAVAGTNCATRRASWVGLKGFSTVATAPAVRARCGVVVSRNSVIIPPGWWATRLVSRTKASPSGRIH